MATRGINIKVSARRAERDFGRPPRSGAVACPAYEVDLDRLSDGARLLAELVDTTHNASDASVVRWATRRSWGDLALEQVLTGGHRMTPREYVDGVRRMYGDDFVDGPVRGTYHWPRMRDDETPEAFLERCARVIQDGGAIITGGFGAGPETRRLLRALFGGAGGE